MFSRRSLELEQRLAALLNADPSDVREYVTGVVEERLFGRNDGARKTGIRFVRGTHAGTYIRHRDGNDILPVGYEPPPESRSSN